MIGNSPIGRINLDMMPSQTRHGLDRFLGRRVTAMGSSGQGKGQWVEGLLRRVDGQWLVDVDVDGFIEVYSVYIDTIRKL
jgi:hypothetical protein